MLVRGAKSAVGGGEERRKGGGRGEGRRKGRGESAKEEMRKLSKCILHVIDLPNQLLLLD